MDAERLGQLLMLLEVWSSGHFPEYVCEPVLNLDEGPLNDGSGNINAWAVQLENTLLPVLATSGDSNLSVVI